MQQQQQQQKQQHMHCNIPFHAYIFSEHLNVNKMKLETLSKVSMRYSSSSLDFFFIIYIPVGAH